MDFRVGVYVAGKLEKVSFGFNGDGFERSLE
jgi:hypothetical protein